MPFRTATLDHIQCGHLDCQPEERHLGANLGLYSITFNNNSVLDREALAQYKDVQTTLANDGTARQVTNRAERLQYLSLADNGRAVTVRIRA